MIVLYSSYLGVILEGINQPMYVKVARRLLIAFVITLFLLVLSLFQGIGYKVNAIDEISFTPYNQLGYADVVFYIDIVFNPILFPSYWLRGLGVITGNFSIKYLPESYYPGEFGGPIWGMKESDRYDIYVMSLVARGLWTNTLLIALVALSVEATTFREIYLIIFSGIVGFAIGDLSGLIFGAIAGCIIAIIIRNYLNRLINVLRKVESVIMETQKFALVMILCALLSVSTLTQLPKAHCTDSGYNFSIQRMINEASPGTVIRIPAGIYHENIIVNKSVTLLGEFNKTIIDGSKVGDVLKICAPNVAMINLTIQSSGDEMAAIRAENLINITIASSLIKSNFYGIYLKNCSLSTVNGSFFENNNLAVWFESSKYIRFTCNHLVWNYGQSVTVHNCESIFLSNNMIKNNPAYGIYLNKTNQSTVSANNISFVCEGIVLNQSCNNSLTSNLISETGPYGIYLNYSKTNLIEQNILIRNEIALQLWGASGNIISNNSLLKNKFGILLWYSGKNTLANNALCDNLWSIGVHGRYLNDFVNEFDSSNTVNGFPVYYWVSRNGGNIRGNAGFVAVVNSTNVLIERVNIKNNFQGILLAFTNFTSIDNVELTLNWHGLFLVNSHKNTVSRSNLISNIFHFYIYNSNGNLFYHNNFVGEKQYYVYNSRNYWDSGYPKGGNFWSWHNSSDYYMGEQQNEFGSDGILDTPFSINDDLDRYPLTNPVIVIRLENFSSSIVISLSGVASMNFSFFQHNATLCISVVLDVAETACRIIVPKLLLWGNNHWQVLLNNEPTNYTISEDNEYTYFYLKVYQGFNKILVIGEGAVPENLSALLLIFSWLTIFLFVRRSPRLKSCSFFSPTTEHYENCSGYENNKCDCRICACQREQNFLLVPRFLY